MATRKSKTADTIAPGVETLLTMCEAIPDELGGMRLLCCEIRTAIAAGDANTATSKAFVLGGLYGSLKTWPMAMPEVRRVVGKEQSKQETAAKAAENRDRVSLLVNRKGMKRSEAIKKVAEERGVDLRTIQRNCKQERQD